MPFLIPILVLVGLGLVGFAIGARRGPGPIGAARPTLVLKAGRIPRMPPLQAIKLKPKRAPKIELGEPVSVTGKRLTVEEFRERYTAIQMRHGKCVEWRWGFSVDDLMEDAATTGGAEAVASIMSYIKAFTGLSVILKIFSFILTFKLWEYRLGVGGPLVFLGFSTWLKIPFDAPPVPLSKVDGYTRGWLKKQRANVYDSDQVYELLLPEFRGGRWAWLVETRDLRTMLREDQIDISTIAKAQCKDGSWKMARYSKAVQHYR